MLVEQSVRGLIAAFRSSEPTPGGGSASALAGAVGAALIAMVAGIPRPRAGSAGDVERLASAGRRAAQLSDELCALVDRDSEAYRAVLAAYTLPKGSEEEARRRSAAIQDALAEAAAVPLDVMRKCADALDASVTAAALGNANASSDVQVAIELLTAGLRGAKANVDVNLGGLKDPRRVEEIRAELARLTSRYRPA